MFLDREHLKTVCDVLGQIGTKASIPALEKLTNNSNNPVKNSARRALKKVRERSG
jgi:HEAT repeat protein